MKRFAVAACLAALCVSNGATAGDVFQEVASYRFGQSRAALDELSRLVRESSGKPEERKRLEARLMALLESDATPDCKAFVCRQLAIAGTASSVRALAKLLDNETLCPMACYALERIPGPEATSALCEALARLKGHALVGAVNSLGQRRDPAAVPALEKLTSSPEEPVWRAAVAALGRIGSPEASSALGRLRKSQSEPLRSAAVDASLECAEGLLMRSKREEAASIYRELWGSKFPARLKAAALRGLFATQAPDAQKLAAEALSCPEPELREAAARIPEAAKALAAKLPTLEPRTQVVLLGTLEEQGGAPEALMLFKSPDPDVRAAAAKAVVRCGAAAVRPLAELAASGSPREREAARSSLDRLEGKDVERAMLELLAGATKEVKLELIRSLGERRSEVASGELLALASGEDPALQIAALKALELVAGASELPRLLELLKALRGESGRKEAERAAIAAARRIPDASARTRGVIAALKETSGPAKASLLRVLGNLGGPEALAAVRGALAEAEPETREAALRALADWPETGPEELLLKLARESEKESHRVIAFRGYLKQAEFIRAKGRDAIPMYQAAWQASPRPEEKKLVLAAIAPLKDVRALRLALDALEEAAVSSEAASTAVEIAKNLGAGNKEAVSALERLATSPDANIRKKAEEALKGLRSPQR